MIDLRKVTKDDIKLLFEWANDVHVRANAKHSEPILWDEHVVWFKKLLSDRSVFTYILTDFGNDIGIIRFNNNSEGFVITYSIDKKYRGKGFGKTILKRGMSNIRKKVKNPIFIGYVKKGNIASEKIFNRLNFNLEEEKIIDGVKYIIYKK